MKVDNYGQHILTEDDICSLYMAEPSRRLHHILCEKQIVFHSDLELGDIPEIRQPAPSGMTLEEFDKGCQKKWFMPQEYVDLDIAEYVLSLCTTDAERQRVGEELLLYLERDLFPLLQYLKYLVDTLRKYNIVWGVGRGSSVGSYVLYLLGVHRINSMYYGLDIKEFLR